MGQTVCYKNKEKHDVRIASGFEKFIVGIAIRVTLSNMSLSAKTNFFIVDEGWSCMDNNNRNNIRIVIEYIKDLYDYVIIISHLEELKGQTEHIINVERINEYSYVTNQRQISTNKIKHGIDIIEV